MSYEPKTWVTGDVITASDLNHMENAIGVFYVTYTLIDEVSTLSASYNDMLTAFNAGKLIALSLSSDGRNEISILTLLEEDSDGYYAAFGEGTGQLYFSSNDADSNMIIDVT